MSERPRPRKSAPWRAFTSSVQTPSEAVAVPVAARPGSTCTCPAGLPAGSSSTNIGAGAAIRGKAGDLDLAGTFGGGEVESHRLGQLQSGMDLRAEGATPESDAQPPSCSRYFPFQATFSATSNGEARPGRCMVRSISALARTAACHESAFRAS